MPYKDKTKQREHQRKWITDRRVAWLKANGPCVVCGSVEDLHVDHIDPTKKISHRVWSWTKAKREAELAKCQVLCCLCHKAKTAKEREPPHGTHGRYVHHRCRCAACKKAHSIINTEWAKQNRVKKTKGP